MDENLSYEPGVEWPDDLDTTPSPAIDDDTTANRWLFARRHVVAELDRIEAARQAHIADVNAWAEDAAHGLNRRLAWLERSLEGYARAVGKSSLKLPGGVLKLSKLRGRVAVAADVDAAVLPDQFQRVRVDVAKQVVTADTTPGPVVDMDDLPDDVAVPFGYTAHAAVTADGEVLPGVWHLVPDDEARTFSVR